MELVRLLYQCWEFLQQLPLLSMQSALQNSERYNTNYYSLISIPSHFLICSFIFFFSVFPFFYCFYKIIFLFILFFRNLLEIWMMNQRKKKMEGGSSLLQVQGKEGPGGKLKRMQGSDHFSFLLIFFFFLEEKTLCVYHE